jgi:hypothetical protein
MEEQQLKQQLIDYLAARIALSTEWYLPHFLLRPKGFGACVVLRLQRLVDGRHGFVQFNRALRFERTSTREEYDFNHRSNQKRSPVRKGPCPRALFSLDYSETFDGASETVFTYGERNGS